MTNVLQTPAERRREKMRETIIDAAERMFRADGEAGLSIRRLADEIDYSPAAIYKYFESKEALVDQLKESFFERLHQRILETLAGRAGEGDAVCMRECIIIYIQTAIAQSQHYAAAFSDVGDDASCGGADGTWDDFEKTHKGAAFAFLIDAVKNGQAAGVFDPHLPADITAKSVWASCHGMAHLFAHMPSMHEMLPGDRQVGQDDVIRHHADLIVRGLMTPAAQKNIGKTNTGLST